MNLVSLETRGQKSLHAGPALHSGWCSFVPLGAANTLASCREPRGHAGFYLEGSRPGAGASGRRRRGTGNAERYAHERLGAHRSSDTAPADGQPGPPAPALGHRDPPTPAVGPPRRTQAPVPGATAARRGDAERGSRRRGAPAGARPRTYRRGVGEQRRRDARHNQGSSHRLLHTHTHTRRTHSSVAGAPGVWRPPAGCCSRGAPIPAASSTAAGGASTEATWAPPIWPRGPPARTHARTHASALGRAGEMEHHRQNLHPLRDMSRTGISSWH